MEKVTLLRTFVADTASMVIFSTAIGVIVEFFIAGLTIEQVVGTRLAALPVILLAGRPYGIYRDWVFRKRNVVNGDQLTAMLADTLANVTFQTPLYVALLALVGATLHQIVVAAGTAILINAVSGRPYGLFLMWIRKLFGM